MSQSAEVLRRFRLAGKRGITRRELELLAGRRFERIIGGLEERKGCLFVRHQSKFSKRTFRWVLVSECPPAVAPAPLPELGKPADVLLAEAYEELALPIDDGTGGLARD